MHRSSFLLPIGEIKLSHSEKNRAQKASIWATLPERRYQAAINYRHCAGRRRNYAGRPVAAAREPRGN